MKTITTMLAVLLVVMAATASNSEGKGTSFEVNTKESKVYWTGKKVTGEHTGYLNISKGTIRVNGVQLIEANLDLDLNTIVCTDLSGEWADKLVGHLKSDDFFSVEKYPEANFKITAINEVNGKHNITGDLTMKGATHSISFPADVNIEEGKVFAKGTALVNRTKWDIRYGSGKFFKGLGDKMIDDEFQITFDLVANSNEELTAN